MVPFFRLYPIVVVACWNEPEQVYCHILGISSSWDKFPCRKIIPKRHFRRHSCDATSKGRGDSWRSRFLDYSTAKKQLHHPTQGVILEIFSVLFQRKFPEVLFFVELVSLANFKFLSKLPEDLKHEEKLEDDCFGESESELFFLKLSWNPAQPFVNGWKCPSISYLKIWWKSSNW